MKNKATTGSFLKLENSWITRKFSLLLFGFFLILLSNMRGSAGIFAWFMPVPYLLYVIHYRGIKNHLWLLLSLVFGSILTFVKAASDPILIPVLFSIMIGMVIGLRLYLTFIIWGYIRKWAGEFIGIIVFPALLVSLEYFQAFYLPFGDWGSFSNTQLYNLPLLQTASLFGFLGVSAIIAWASVLIASIIQKGSFSNKGLHISIFVVTITALYIYGDLRINQVPEGKYVQLAAIMVNNDFTGELPNPDNKDIKERTDQLLEKTRIAAQKGVSVIVWGEISAIVTKEGERKLIDSLIIISKAHKVAIVAAYAVPVPEGEKEDYNFENKFTWISEKGEIAETYIKHHPVPGAGSEKGYKPLKLVHTEFGNMAGAICYDYDFPQMSLTQARLGADLVVVPGMDWRGMLMQHTLMARKRAIEGGFSVLRSANEATSMGFNNYGQIMAAMPDFGNNDRILIASLPVGKVNTLYTTIGNLIAYISIIVSIFSIFISVRNFRNERKTANK